MIEPAVLTCTAVRLVNLFIRLKAMKRVEARKHWAKAWHWGYREKREYSLSLVTDSDTGNLFVI